MLRFALQSLLNRRFVAGLTILSIALSVALILCLLDGFSAAL